MIYHANAIIRIAIKCTSEIAICDYMYFAMHLKSVLRYFGGMIAPMPTQTAHVQLRACMCMTYHLVALAGDTLQASWFSFPAATAKLTPCMVKRSGGREETRWRRESKG